MWRQEGLGIPGNTVATGCALELAHWRRGNRHDQCDLSLILGCMAAMTVA